MPHVRQPDPRVSPQEIGFWNSQVTEEGYVIHDKPGCPVNALIEEFDGYLRCSGCFQPLTDRAAGYVRESFQQTGRHFLKTVICKFCQGRTLAVTAHPHQGSWVGDECCWDERLRTTE